MKEAQSLLRLSRSLLGGTSNRTIRGEGWTEKEALDDAMENDQREYGHGEGYGGGYGSMREVEKVKQIRKPKRATRVKVEKATVRKGPVKKAYTISAMWGFSSQGMSPVERDKRLRERYKTQMDALKAAKALALEYGVELSVDLEAFCVGDTHLATVKPMKGQKGIWVFDVAFRS